MTSIPDLLAEATGAAEPVSEAVIAADIERGRRALRLRRRRMVAVSGTATAVIAVVAVAPWSSLSTPDTTMPAASPPAITTSSHADMYPPMAAYGGPQQGGFASALAPQGWTTVADDEFQLVLAAHPDSSIRETIGINLRSLDGSDEPPTAAVPHETAAGVIYIGRGDGTDTVVTRLTDRGWLEIIMPGRADWSDQELLEFAANVTVRPTAQRGQG